ncbi:hypothetical protein COO91_09922 (plasmid) [Nostoc flagelliforme CCNUN1]|uniref:Uncharacterized protein n=1 Tax=Nostoc flagelliforme CCNUN1 TaxID=2038116 RepID=A0A2K8T7T3_9NOSO|nr:hypothetical protein COO91_09922 [Nostoc flagelliforme CCNUN1]
MTIFEFKIQNLKFKMNNLNNFELINSGYKPPLIQRISGLQSVAGFRASTDCNNEIDNA